MKFNFWRLEIRYDRGELSCPVIHDKSPEGATYTSPGQRPGLMYI